jgi:hypothetical protein
MSPLWLMTSPKPIGFYESLGFKLLQRWGDYYAQLTAPGITIGLHPSKDQPNISENILLALQWMILQAAEIV